MASKPVAAASLQSDHSGWMTKVGGGVRTWKKRWFILSGKKLYYFKTKKDLDATGFIELSSECHVSSANKKKEKKYCFAVKTQQRVYLMYPDTENEMQDWMTKLNNVIKGGASGGGGGTIGAGSSMGSTPSNGGNLPSPKPEKSTDLGAGQEHGTPLADGPRGKLDQGKDAIPWLHSEDSKVLEFWQIWSESIPPHDEVVEGGAIVFEVSTSADMEKLSWRASGPQNIFIQKMVDFFWNVGAPESEIDRLNDVGALINPNTIGSWIDMSSKGGMDGGWFFPVDVDIKRALEAADPGDPCQTLGEWVQSNAINLCVFVGRDMGAAPPRQTEIRFYVTGATFDEQLEKALQAYTIFNIPPIPDDVIDIIKSSGDFGVPAMSVITSSEGFVRLGLMLPHPDRSMVQTLCNLGGTANPAQLLEFQDCLGVSGPEWVEFQYLMQGFGYGVYKEGFDVVFHYKRIGR